MKLNRLELSHYRNIESLELCPCDGINILYGDNAQGKTNLVEAVWLFTGNPSFRGGKLRELTRFGEDEARLKIRFEDREREQEAELWIDGAAGRKKALLNRVECRTAGDLNGAFYAVVFSPAHLSFVKEGPKNRRHFLDIAISQIKLPYRNYLLQYEKLLDQRNALLRNASKYRNLEQNIEVWDLQLAKAGTILSIFRYDYIKKLQTLSARIYEGLSRRKESLGLRYLSTVFEGTEEPTAYDTATVEQYCRKLKESFQSDLHQGFTGIGPHRDDLEVEIDGRSARVYGSQGQQRSSVIALKLAEAHLLKKAVGEDPVMLLDDVMSELDVSRQDYILNHLKGMQVFLTCCDISNTMKLREGKVFHVEGGHLREETAVDSPPEEEGCPCICT